MRAPRTLLFRLTCLAALVAALATLPATIALNHAASRNAGREAADRARSTALAARAVIVAAGPTDGPAALRAAPELAARVWILGPDGPLVRGQGDAVLQHAVGDAARRSGPHDLAGRARLHTVALPARDGPGRRLVAVQPLVHRELELHLVLVVTILGALGLTAAAGAVTFVVVRRAVAPARDATRAAQDWSERDLGRGLAVGAADGEVGALVGAMDGLLGRLEASLRQSRQLSTDLSHELRTPLARIVSETELLRRSPRDPDDQARSLEVIGRSAAEMDRIIGSLMSAARAERAIDRGRGELEVILEDVAADWGATARQRGRRLELSAPAGAGVGAPPELVARILGPLISNALGWSRAVVGVDVERDGRRVRLCVDDDGPGIGGTDPEELFLPGVRGTAAEGDGAGLGLALARRLAHGVGGSVTYGGPSRAGGARFVVDLPA